MNVTFLKSNIFQRLNLLSLLGKPLGMGKRTPFSVAGFLSEPPSTYYPYWTSGTGGSCVLTVIEKTRAFGANVFTFYAGYQVIWMKFTSVKL